jgi:hypothetical protein
MLIELAATAWLAASAAGATQAGAMFERMLALAGEWQGTFEWTDGRTGTGELRVRYTVTGAGSALIEDLISPEGVATMSTVYHLDGDDLRMTHYCAARNQPRLVSSRFSDSPPAADFRFIDVTGSTKFGSVRAFRIEILDEDHLNLTFTFGGNPKTNGVEHIQLSRSGSPGAA